MGGYGILCWIILGLVRMELAQNGLPIPEGINLRSVQVESLLGLYASRSESFNLRMSADSYLTSWCPFVVVEIECNYRKTNWYVHAIRVRRRARNDTDFLPILQKKR
jgi:hypothetical protein